MTLGIFAKTFTRPTVDDVFDAVAKHRLHQVQFNFACVGLPSLPDQIDPGLANHICDAASERRVAIAAVSGTFNMVHPDPAQRRDGLRKLAVIAGVCERLGTNLVTICTGTRDPENMWRRHPDNASPEAWRDLLVTLTKALTTADKHGITLGMEPETGNVINSAEKARRLLDEMKSPRLKIVMDAANLFHPDDMRCMKEILEDAFDLIGRDIILAHAKDLGADGHAGDLTLGAGVLDWDLYLSLLRRASYSGALIMHGFDECAVPDSAAFLRGKTTQH